MCKEKYSIRMNRAPEFTNTETRSLKKLGGLRRTQESTIGAIGNVLGGAGEVVFSKGNRLKGLARVGQGVLDGLDIVPSFAADSIRFVTGPKGNETGASEYQYNITRALGSAKEVQDPLGAIGAATDIIHASVFKLGSDALQAYRNN